MSSVRQHISFFIRICLFIITIQAGYSQVRNRVAWSDRQPGMQILSSGPEGLTVSLDISYLRFIEMHTSPENFLRIIHGDFIPDYHSGDPELPVIRKMIEVPAHSKVIIARVSFEKHNFHLPDYGLEDKIYPNQPSLQKSADTQPQEFQYNKKIYSRNAFIGDSLVSVRPAGILRGRQLVYLTFSPFSYNPVTNTLEVKDHIVLDLRFEGGDMAKTVSRHKSLSTPVFENTFSKILNYSAGETKSVTAPPLKMVILTDTVFKNSLDDFIRWKRAKGIEVIVAYKGSPEVGSTATDMKAYLTNLYYSATPDNPAPSYLLIIGDVAQIPPSANPGHVTDLYYAEYDGNGDYIPDIYFGRFSARDSLELAAILERNLEYEQYLFPDPSFLGEAVMIAGVDGAYASVWGNGQINYGTGYYYNTGHGILSHTYLYPESGSSDAQIIADISNGVGFVNYTGHGYWNRWEDPRFSIYDIDGLQNNHKFPLMIGNGCVTATFGYDECFAEALIRTPGKGALSYIGGSDDSYWDEDYYWAVGVGPIVANPKYEETGPGMYDRLFHDHQEPETEWYINQSQMVFAGNMAVMTGVPSRAKYYWEIYQLLGDPSLMIYLSVPETLSVNVPSRLPITLTSLTVITEDNTLVSLTRADTIIATALADNEGIATLSLPPLQDTGKIRIVATRQNRQPYSDSILVVSNDYPYISLEATSIDDSSMNQNGLADYGEDIYVGLQIHNFGITDAQQVSGTLSTNSGWVTVTDSVMDIISLVAAQNDTVITKAFLVRINDSVPDGRNVTFSVRFTDVADSVWTSYFTLRLHAPDFSLGTLTINDLIKGNGNRRLEPGESVKLNLQISNNGSAPSDSIIISVSMPDSMVTYYEKTLNAGVLSPVSGTLLPVSLTIDPAVAYGTPLYVNVSLTAGSYVLEKTYTIPVGLSFDDFELGNFSAVPWQSDTLYPWTITDGAFYEGSFSARSGAITHYQSSSLSLHLETFQDDSVHFFAKVSSEKDWDFLRFYIDNVEMGKWSGEMAWKKLSFPLTAGNHTLTWKYTKDANTSRGFDAAWVDYVVFPLFSFSTIDAGVQQILSPKSGSGLTDAEQLTVTVRNFGNQTLSNIPVGFIFDDDVTRFDTIHATITPGDTVDFTFFETLNLMTVGTHYLKVFTHLTGDQVPVNDTLTVTVTHTGVIDISLDTLIAPAPDSVYTANETIGIRLLNLSSGSVKDIPLSYTINDAPAVTEIAADTLSPGDTLDYFFLQTADLSDTGHYEIKVYCSMAEDAIMSNDTLHINLYNYNTYIDPGRIIEQLKLYPNPVYDYLSLDIEVSDPVTFDMLIIDITGKVYFHQMYVNQQGTNHHSLQVSNLGNGTYFLIITNRAGTISIPFIKTAR